jgi:hypothetical protein
MIRTRQNEHSRDYLRLNEMLLTIGSVMLNIGNFQAYSLKFKVIGVGTQRKLGFDQYYGLLVIHARFPFPAFVRKWIYNVMSILVFYSIMMTWSEFLSHRIYSMSGDKVTCQACIIFTSLVVFCFILYSKKTKSFK